MRKWELYEKHKAGIRKDLLELSERYEKKVDVAKEELRKAEIELETVLQREFKEGKELTSEKVAARGKIANAQISLREAESEMDRAKEYITEEQFRERVTAEDLVKDWNGFYAPLIREKEVAPIAKRIEEARAQYLNALMDYFELRSEYAGIYSEINQSYLDETRNKKGPHYAVHEIVTTRDLKLITNADLFEVEDKRELPRDVERVKVGEKRG
ncbi:hypothetical protein [Bacillus sp. JJ1562]|uniref:hypothetical protein n=1 Tax=Bacillus sp. JJ1562 TaxID=3122960 RepID=UPI0030029DD6